MFFVCVWGPKLHKETPQKSSPMGSGIACFGCTPKSLKSSALTKSFFSFNPSYLLHYNRGETNQPSDYHITPAPRHFYLSEKDERFWIHFNLEIRLAKLNRNKPGSINISHFLLRYHSGQEKSPKFEKSNENLSRTRTLQY